MACLAWGNYMLLNWFIGFYTCFVALVFYFISVSNHFHQAQTSPFGCIHCSPKQRGFKEVKHHEPRHNNKPKRSQNRSTRPEQAWAKVARAALLESEAENYTSDARLTGRASWLGSSEVHSHFQSFWSSADLIQEHSTSARLIEHNGSGRAELNFTFCPIFEVSDVGPEGGSTGQAGFARVEQNGRQQHVRSF